MLDGTLETSGWDPFQTGPLGSGGGSYGGLTGFLSKSGTRDL